MIKTGKIKVNVGDIISTIILSSTSNSKVNLFEEAQKNNLILFFFPGYGIGKTYSELSGCTLEGKMFRDNNQAIQKLNGKVFGISLQSTEQQRQFVENEKLNFELLSDKEKELSNILGVPLWTAPTGEQFTDRTTFIIKKGGEIAYILENVVPNGHIEEVIQLLSRL